MALKKIFEAFRNLTDAQRTYREICFLKAFRAHPNIIGMVDAIPAKNNQDLYLVFEYMESDLHNAITRKIFPSDKKSLYFPHIIYQILRGFLVDFRNFEFWK